MNRKELHGHKFINGLVVLVGKASIELDMGREFYLCQTFPPHPQRFFHCMDQTAAEQWLREAAGAEVVYLVERAL